MRVNRKTPDRYSIEYQNETNKERIERALLVASNYQNDPDRKARQDKSLCKVCHYATGRVGGASVTSRHCGLCDTILTSGNTCVELLCKPCAKRSGLCCYCGSDIELVNRKKRDLADTSHVFFAAWTIGGVEHTRSFDWEDDAEYFANAKMADLSVQSTRVFKQSTSGS